MNTEPTLELPLFRAAPEDPNVERLRELLHTYGWLKREQIVKLTGWSERTVRALAEAMGADVVRGQAGFKLTADLADEEIGLGLQAARVRIAQGQHELRYGLALLRRLHGRVG